MSGRRRALAWALRLVGPIILVVVISQHFDSGAELLALLGQLAIWPLLGALALNLPNMHLKVVRWRMLLGQLGVSYDNKRAWRAILSSTYLALATPGRVGDLMRIQYLRHDVDLRYSEGLGVSVIDRLCDVYVLVIFAAFGFFRYMGILSDGMAALTWIAIGGSIIAPLVLLLPGFGQRLMRAVYKRVSPDASGLDRFLEVVRALTNPRLAFAVGLTALALLGNCLQAYLLARSLGIALPFGDATAILALESLLGLLPISISGVGVRELLVATVFPAIGHPADAGVAFGLLIFASIYLVFMSVGFISWQISPPPVAADRELKTDEA